MIAFAGSLLKFDIICLVTAIFLHLFASHQTLDLFRNSICLLKLPFLSPLSLNFSTI